MIHFNSPLRYNNKKCINIVSESYQRKMEEQNGHHNLTSREELINFRGINTDDMSNVESEIPAHSMTRRLTDKKGLLIGGVLLAAWLFFVVYFLKIELSDFRRIFFPTDICANLCGIDNQYIHDVNCSGQDYSSKPYLRENECVSQCPYNLSFGQYTCVRRIRRIGDKFKLFPINIKGSSDIIYKDLFQPARTPWWKFILLFMLTIVLCLIPFFCSCPLNCKKCFLSSYIVIVVIIDTYFLGRLAPDDWNGEVAIFFFTHLGIVAVIIISAGHVTELFIPINTVATSVMRQIPSLLIPTLLIATFQILVTGYSLFAFFSAITSTELIKLSEIQYEFAFISGLKKFLAILFMLCVNWIVQFIVGFHCMIVAGAVSSWYFKTNTEFLPSIHKSFLWTIKYHMGTVAYWALFQPWIDIFKYLTNFFVICPNCIFTGIDRLTLYCEYFSKHSLIETAIHGQPLLKSGKRAYKAITSAEGILVGKLLTNLYWLLPQFELFIITALISHLSFLHTDHTWIPLIICLFGNLIIISVFLETSKIVANTILICYFEDKLILGAIRPYQNMQNLEKFIEKAKEFNPIFCKMQNESQ